MSSCSRWGVALLLGALGAGCGGFNKSPVVTVGPELSQKDVTSGTEVQVHLVVTDAEGDELLYTWIQVPPEPAGRYSDTTVKEPSWIAPEVTAARSFLLQVNIRDGEGNSLLSWTTIQVRPRQ